MRTKLAIELNGKRVCHRCIHLYINTRICMCAYTRTYNSAVAFNTGHDKNNSIEVEIEWSGHKWDIHKG